jgi:hypothetical protein
VSIDMKPAPFSLQGRWGNPRNKKTLAKYGNLARVLSIQPGSLLTYDRTTV